MTRDDEISKLRRVSKTLFCLQIRFREFENGNKVLKSKSTYVFIGFRSVLITENYASEAL